MRPLPYIGKCESCGKPLRITDEYKMWQDDVMTCAEHSPKASRECPTCGREHWCDDPSHTLVECERIIAKLKADLAEAVLILQKVRPFVDRAPEQYSDYPYALNFSIDNFLKQHRSTT